MSAPPPAASNANDVSISQKVKNTDPVQMRRILKIVNVLNAGLLAAAGIVAFLVISLDLLVVLSAIYVIGFSLCLLFFELRLKMCDSMLYNNFGFMFNWKGRVLFFIFIGTLTFGLGVLGIVAGACTIVNMIFNVYVMNTHPQLSKVDSEEDKKRAQNLQFNVSVDPNKTMELVQNASAAYKASGAGNAAPASPATTSGDWEKLYDPNTQQHYYHNHATGETKWTAP